MYYDYYQANRDLLIFCLKILLCGVPFFKSCLGFFWATVWALWKWGKSFQSGFIKLRLGLCRLYIRVVAICLLFLALQIMLNIVAADLRLLKDFEYLYCWKTWIYCLRFSYKIILKLETSLATKELPIIKKPLWLLQLILWFSLHRAESFNLYVCLQLCLLRR